MSLRSWQRLTIGKLHYGEELLTASSHYNNVGTDFGTKYWVLAYSFKFYIESIPYP